MCDRLLENMVNGVVLLSRMLESINHSILINKMNEQLGIIGTKLNWCKIVLDKKETAI